MTTCDDLACFVGFAAFTRVYSSDGINAINPQKHRINSRYVRVTPNTPKRFFEKVLTSGPCLCQSLSMQKKQQQLVSEKPKRGYCAQELSNGQVVHVKEGYKLVPCNGEAHNNPHIDNCMVCLHTMWDWRAERAGQAGFLRVKDSLAEILRKVDIEGYKPGRVDICQLQILADAAYREIFDKKD